MVGHGSWTHFYFGSCRLQVGEMSPWDLPNWASLPRLRMRCAGVACCVGLGRIPGPPAAPFTVASFFRRVPLLKETTAKRHPWYPYNLQNRRIPAAVVPFYPVLGEGSPKKGYPFL